MRSLLQQSMHVKFHLGMKEESLGHLTGWKRKIEEVICTFCYVYPLDTVLIFPTFVRWPFDTFFFVTAAFTLENSHTYIIENVNICTLTYFLYVTQFQNAVTCVSNIIHFALSIYHDILCERRKKNLRNRCILPRLQYRIRYKLGTLLDSELSE